MKKIRNLQELRSEKARLVSEIAQERESLVHGFRTIAHYLTPLSVGLFVGRKLLGGIFSSNHRNNNGSNIMALSSWMPTTTNGFIRKGVEYGSAWLVSKMIKNPLLKTMTVLGLPILVKYYPVIAGNIRRLWSKVGR